MLAKVFISYRRDDSPYAARLIRDALVTRFGHRDVFFDVENILPSEEWRKRIESEIAESKAIVVVIGKRWKTLLKKADPKNDLVRIEINTAFTNKAKLYAVLVDNITPRTISNINDLEFVKSFQYCHLRTGKDGGKDLSELVQLIGGTISPLVKIQFARIPAGSYVVGSSLGQEYEKPTQVQIARSFKIARWPLTFREQELLLPLSNRIFPRNADRNGDNLPAHNLSWVDAINICNSLSRQHGLPDFYDSDGNIAARDGRGFRIPTEVEWEIACNLGFRDVDLSNDENHRRYARFGLDESEGEPGAVTERCEDGLSCYGMLGNIREWCWDYFHMEYFASMRDGKKINIDPSQDDPTDARVVRGGCYCDPAELTLPWSRQGFPPNERHAGNGVRIAQSCDC